jgi:hypothetical protein
MRASHTRAVLVIGRSHHQREAVAIDFSHNGVMDSTAA